MNNEYPPLGGGAGNATLFMAKALVALGHEPTVLTSAMAGLPRFSQEDGIRVHRVRTWRRSADRTNVLEMAAFLVAACWSARRVAKAARADSVVAFFTIPCGPVAWLLKRVLGLPYVVSLRGGDVPGHVREINVMHRIVAPLRRRVLREACAVVANAPGLARLSERSDPVPVLVIPNGVDSTVFRPDAQRGPEDPGPFRILFVGRLHELKNIDLLLEALAQLRGAGIDARLGLVGDGPHRPELEALAARLGVGAQVTWHGWRPKEEVAALYRGASCFVNPSRYEGMPNTVLEAMASGLPVVASDVGGNNDLVVPGENGLLFDLAERGALGRSLEALARDAAAARAMGERGRERVAAEYSWLGVTRRYLALLPAPPERGRAPAAVQSSDVAKGVNAR